MGSYLDVEATDLVIETIGLSGQLWRLAYEVTSGSAKNHSFIWTAITP